MIAASDGSLNNVVARRGLYRVIRPVLDLENEPGMVLRLSSPTMSPAWHGVGADDNDWFQRVQHAATGRLRRVVRPATGEINIVGQPARPFGVGFERDKKLSLPSHRLGDLS